MTMTMDLQHSQDNVVTQKQGMVTISACATKTNTTSTSSLRRSLSADMPSMMNCVVTKACSSEDLNHFWKGAGHTAPEYYKPPQSTTSQKNALKCSRGGSLKSLCDANKDHLFCFFILQIQIRVLFLGRQLICVWYREHCAYSQKMKNMFYGKQLRLC